MRRRLLAESEETEVVKEWRLLDIIDFSIDKDKTYNVDGVTEIFLQGNLLKCEKDTNSNIAMRVNKTDIGAMLVTNRSSATGNYQHLYAKWNGLFWDIVQSDPAVLKSNLTLTSGSSKRPYNVVMNVGEALELYFSAASAGSYPVESGTVEIYVR